MRHMWVRIPSSGLIRRIPGSSPGAPANMKTYIITYHLKNTWENYSEFYEAIKESYPEFQHFQEEAWLVKTDDTAKEIIAKIKPFLKRGDTIFVVEITDNYEGFIAKSVWKWLKLENGYNKEKI